MTARDGVTRREFIKTGTAATLARGLAVAGATGRSLPGATHATPQTERVNSVDYPDKISTGLERPQKISLDGDWKFRLDPKDVGENQKWFEPGRITDRTMKVPLPWELASDDLRDYAGVAWYEREVVLPAGFARGRTAVGFHGVSHHAKVWVNGEYAGEHTGAQASFLLDVTGIVRPAKRVVVTVRAFNPRSGVQFFMDISSLLRVSGLWQSVWMEATGQTFISDLFMIPDIDKSRATARTCVYVPPSKGKKPLQLTVTAIDSKGKKAEKSQALELEGKPDAGGFFTTDLIVDIPEALMWDLEQPNLYSVQGQLSDSNGKVIDVALTEFGMRKIEARDGRFWLNNKVFYIVAAGPNPTPYGGSGDINWSLPGPYAYPDEEEIRSDIEKIKSLNFNLMRSALRPMHPQWLRLADRMGLLVMQEGSWTRFKNLQGYKDNWAEMLLRDRNHPSAAIWTLFNESWGIEYADPLYAHVKKLDPTRLVVDNSGGHVLQGPNYAGNHGKTDFEDVHNYPSFNRFDTARDYWLGLRSVKHPLWVTEFGPIPYIFDVEKMKKAWNGKDVWWLKAKELTLDWHHGKMVEEWDHIGFEERFHDWGMDKIYGDWDRFTKAHDWYFYWGLKSQTQWMRMNPEINGFNIWLYDDSNHPLGFIDYYRNKKVFADELGKTFTQDLVILANRQHEFWGGQQHLYANLHISHFSSEDIADARIQWSLEQSDLQGEVRCGAIAPGSARFVGDLQLKVPEVSIPVMRRLSARLVSGQGKTLSENYEPIWIYPAGYNQASEIPFAAWGIENANLMAWTGYKVVPGEENPKLAVVAKVDEKARKYLGDGGTVILLPEEQDDFLTRNGLTLGSSLLGGHSNAFYARKGLGIFDRIPYENPYIWQFRGIWPEVALFGVTPENKNDILAGAYMNYLHKQCATMAQFRCSKGRLIICTFRLRNALEGRPAAVIILNDLLKYAAGNFQPGASLVI